VIAYFDPGVRPSDRDLKEFNGWGGQDRARSGLANCLPDASVRFDADRFPLPQ
jgi:hypothetical protein